MLLLFSEQKIKLLIILPTTKIHTIEVSADGSVAEVMTQLKVRLTRYYTIVCQTASLAKLPLGGFLFIHEI